MRPIGKLERLARERHERDLQLSRLAEGHPRGLWFDEAAADRVVQFIERYCRHHEGEWAGQKIRLEEWQKRDVIRPMFGWKRRDGLRRFRTAYVEIPRKNGKSLLCSALGLYLLVADGEPGAQIYASATKKDQAKIVWDGAEKMVARSPDLQRFIKRFRSAGGTLVCERMGSKFSPLGADSKTLDGLNPHANLVDELHAHRDRSVWDVLDTAMGARRQPLTVAITTAGTYDEESIGWQQHDHAVHVLEGAYEDDTFFAYIAALDEGDDPLSVQTQQKANPNYGVSVKPDKLVEQAQKARREPSFFNEYVRLHLNGWTQQVTRWLPIEPWLACYRRDFDERAFVGRDCIAGLDLSSTSDLTAFVLIFQGEDGMLDVIPRFWLPRETIDNAAKVGRTYYAQWEREGYLKATPGNVVDYDFIRAEIGRLAADYRITEIAFDPYNATQMSNNLAADGFTLVLTRQGFLTISEPSKLLEVKVMSGKLRHGSPVLHWNGLNASIESDAAGNIKPVKDIQRTNKIDGISALATALSRIVGAESPTLVGDLAIV
jgi:phage terminase large subunit-like protein